MNRIELIYWRDATSSDPWEEIEEAKKLQPHIIKSVGLFVDEDDQRVLIALNYDERGGAVSQTLAIPHSWIMERLIFIDD